MSNQGDDPRLGRPLTFLVAALLCAGFLAGCGGGGGGGGGFDPAAGSNWDEMVWDQGTWA